MSALGIGDLRLLLGTQSALRFPTAPVAANTPFGQFVARSTGICSIFVLVDAPMVHLSVTSQGLTQTGGVDGGRYLDVGQWNMFQFLAVAGDTYSFQVTAPCDVTLDVAYSPLMS